MIESMCEDDGSVMRSTDSFGYRKAARLAGVLIDDVIAVTN
jgi:hypothetical protein